MFAKHEWAHSVFYVCVPIFLHSWSKNCFRIWDYYLFYLDVDRVKLIAWFTSLETLWGEYLTQVHTHTKSNKSICYWVFCWLKKYYDIEKIAVCRKDSSVWFVPSIKNKFLSAANTKYMNVEILNAVRF